MSDRRSQRIRNQLRQHPNPRSYTDDPAKVSLHGHLRRVYQPAAPTAPATVDLHGQLARQLAAQRRSRS